MSLDHRSKSSRNPLTLVLILAGIFFVIFLFASTALYFSKFSFQGGKEHTPGLFHSNSVAIVELNGVILDSKKTLKRLTRAEEDPEIKAVVMRLNSPGGAVAPSQEIYEAVKKFKKPLVVSMSSVAASGAFYIACGAKKVFANPGTITGSIGVIMEFANLEKLYEWAKIQRYSIKTGRFKDAGADYRALTPEDRALLQGMVDDVLVQFKQAVSTGRKLKMEQVDQIADGRILSGHQAKVAHLVDELGTIDDAIQEAAKLGGVQGKPHLVYPDEPKRKLLELLLDSTARDSDSDSDSESSLGGVGRIVDTFLNGALHGSLEGRGREKYSAGLYWLWGSVK